MKPELVMCECGYPRAVGYACTACRRYDSLPRYSANKDHWTKPLPPGAPSAVDLDALWNDTSADV